MAQTEPRPVSSGKSLGEHGGAEVMTLQCGSRTFLPSRVRRYCQVKMCHAHKTQAKAKKTVIVIIKKSTND